MQDLLFFMEPSEHEWITALNIGNLYLNRFSINEDDAFEIIGEPVSLNSCFVAM